MPLGVFAELDGVAEPELSAGLGWFAELGPLGEAGLFVELGPGELELLAAFGLEFGLPVGGGLLAEPLVDVELVAEFGFPVVAFPFVEWELLPVPPFVELLGPPTEFELLAEPPVGSFVGPWLWPGEGALFWPSPCGALLPEPLPLGPALAGPLELLPLEPEPLEPPALLPL